MSFYQSVTKNNTLSESNITKVVNRLTEDASFRFLLNTRGVQPAAIMGQLRASSDVIYALCNLATTVNPEIYYDTSESKHFSDGLIENHSDQERRFATRNSIVYLYGRPKEFIESPSQEMFASIRAEQYFLSCLVIGLVSVMDNRVITTSKSEQEGIYTFLIENYKYVLREANVNPKRFYKGLVGRAAEDSIYAEDSQYRFNIFQKTLINYRSLDFVRTGRVLGLLIKNTQTLV